MGGKVFETDCITVFSRDNLLWFWAISAIWHVVRYWHITDQEFKALQSTSLKIGNTN
jgi:hypothetical protein